MEYKSIADIYAANERFRNELKMTLDPISDQDAAREIEGSKWTIRQIVEHVAIVENGISRICRRLLDAAKQAGKPAKGGFELSSAFSENMNLLATQKLEAPEQVHPTGNVAIADSLGLMRSTESIYTEMHDDLAAFDLSVAKSPHPYFGDLDALEWMILKGLHEARHTAQIRRLSPNP